MAGCTELHHVALRAHLFARRMAVGPDLLFLGFFFDHTYLFFGV
jgi:hypothetical protein